MNPTQNLHTRPSALRSWSRRGMTILELMVVVVIIGILGAASVPTITRRMRAQDSYDAAREVTLQMKRARYRAQGLNRAMGLVVSSTGITLQISLDNQCSNLNLGVPTQVLDMGRYPDIVLSGKADWFNKLICIRPRGQVNDKNGLPFSGTADGPGFSGGTLAFSVQHTDGISSAHLIELPYNGVARLVR